MILLCSLNHLITFFFIHCHWFLAKDVRFLHLQLRTVISLSKFCRTCYNHRINIFIFHNVKIFFVKKIYSQLFCCILCHITYRITNCDDLTSTVHFLQNYAPCIIPARPEPIRQTFTSSFM